MDASKKIKKNIRLLKKILFHNDSDSHNLVVKHLVALAVIIATIAVTFFLLLSLNSLKANDAHYINLSGQQRYLSQQSALMMHKYYEENKKSYADQIINILKKIHTNQKKLSQNIDHENVPLYENIDKEIKNFLLLAVDLLEVRKSKTNLLKFDKKANRLLILFDQVTFLNEEILSKKIQVFEIFIIISGMILLLTILIEAIFIFRPAILEILKKTQNLKILNYKLEKKVALGVEKNREQELLLMQKTKAAQMGDLVNNIAHQWRQPITIISLYLDTISMDLEDESVDKIEIQDYLQKSKETLTHMSQTIDDFRSFFVPSDKDENIDVIDSINRVEKLLHHHFIHHNISISQKIEKPSLQDQYKIKGRKGELEQCLMILLNNAKDAILKQRRNDPNCGNIDISLYKHRYHIVIKIKDDGGGISKEVGDKLFKPYFTTKGEEGTGVGLYICKNIIQNRFKGKLHFETRGKNTSFMIEI